jgi:hypothetical protein
MAANRDIPSHSARVCMTLHLDGSALAISHLGPDFLILAEPIDYPPSQAEITLSVDGRERRWAVFLPAGLSSASRRTSILPCARLDGSAAGTPR